MNYEKEYQDALKRAKKLYEQGTITETLSYIFPELAESEDERIKKEFCKDIWTFIPNERAHKYIAWLEKQGQTFTKKDIDDAYLKGVSDAKHELEKKELKKINSYCQEHCKGYQETGKCFADGDCKDKREA